MKSLDSAIVSIESVLFQSMPFSSIPIQGPSLELGLDLGRLGHELHCRSAAVPDLTDDMDILSFVAYPDGTVRLDAVYGKLIKEDDVSIRLFGRFEGEGKELVFHLSQAVCSGLEDAPFSFDTAEDAWFSEDAGLLVHAEPLQGFDIHVECRARPMAFLLH